ncbi:copper homeostasis protein CutC [Roseibium litorale]|uniref:PF03932 family protein CutC n=1 Tax=Roseibium litorale TaxID=2803841 RepID=A0ABR9CK32_9HYPH|nr:copper homeostasis protein CutC [Roseibium litorale]MBD8891215.1 copper homeostasis protein CutC [Roseibium litorale]
MTTSAHTTPDSVLLEVCVDTMDGLLAAVEGGADRIELCSALSTGGLTPSPGFMRQAASAGIPIYPLIRPRQGGFQYSQAEIGIIKRDIEAAADCGLPGVVIGVSTEDGRLDTKTLSDLIKHADTLDVTLHRAFDLAPDLTEALEAAIDLGFSRILTSGGAPTAEAGLDQLAALAERAGDRISIMPGSGINPGNAARFTPTLAIKEIHASCSTVQTVTHQRLLDLGFLSGCPKQTDAGVVRQLKALLAGRQP